MEFLESLLTGLAKLTEPYWLTIDALARIGKPSGPAMSRPLWNATRPVKGSTR